MCEGGGGASASVRVIMSGARRLLLVLKKKKKKKKKKKTFCHWECILLRIKKKLKDDHLLTAVSGIVTKASYFRNLNPSSFY